MMSLKILCHLCYLLLLLKADIKFLYPITLCEPVVSSAGARSAPNYQRQPAAAPKNSSPALNSVLQHRCALLLKCTFLSGQKSLLKSP